MPPGAGAADGDAMRISSFPTTIEIPNRSFLFCHKPPAVSVRSLVSSRIPREIFGKYNMDSQQRDRFKILVRERDAKAAIDLLGCEYDYASDPAGVVNLATWYGDPTLLLHALGQGGSASSEGENGHPLGIAASMGHLQMIGPLLEHGAAIDARDNYGRSALTLAAGAGHLSVVKALVQRGANLTGGLYAAARSTHVPMAKYLVGQGADLDEVSQDVFEMTPLMAACSRGKKKGSEIALLLLQAGAGVGYTRQSDGMSALKFALGNCTNEVVVELKRRGSPPVEPEFRSIRLA